jgi:hypothetical protein
MSASIKFYDGINDNFPEFINSEIAILLKTIDKLIPFGVFILSPGITANEDDYFASMAITFCRRQVDHLSSLISLYRANLYPDMQLIARSMIEGFAFLYWGVSNKGWVPLRWCSYAAVTDYRLAMKHLSKGVVPETDKQKIEEMLKKYGKPFLKKKNQELNIDFKTDPFIKYWNVDNNGEKVSARKVFNNLKADPLSIAYEDMSDWIHWSTRGFGPILARNENIVGYDYLNKKLVPLALSSAIIAFTESFYSLTRHLKLDAENQLNDIQRKHIQEMDCIYKQKSK